MSRKKRRSCGFFRRLVCHQRPGAEPEGAEPNGEAVEIDPDQRIGLALSGGGFRAAFFHLGVLARLAEGGVLPRVEVISTVSGGSIIGTAYYLMVRNLLQEKDVDRLSRADYIGLVEDLEHRTRFAVSYGMRGRMLANPLKNLAMISPWLPKGRRYSRTDRIGDMVDRYLYKRIFWGEDPACFPKRDNWIPVRGLRRDRQVELREILIRPIGGELAGKPKEHNRAAGLEFKVPELAINATCLNTGHRWCFEAKHMGEETGLREEPDPGEGSEPGQQAQRREPDDGNVTLSPGHFLAPGEQPTKDRAALPDNLQDFPLGQAVAASAAFPGAFPALPVTGMYSDLRVLLSDGGVSDNQGVQALADHECNVMIVSDGSGQMKDLPRLGGGAIASLGRAASIQGDRVRELQLQAPKADEDVSVHTVHLREGLSPAPLRPGGTYAEPVWSPGGEAIGGWPVHPRALEAISRIRTDLDTFSRNEIDSLAACGYLLTNRQFEANGKLAELAAPVENPRTWRFIGRVGDKLATGDANLIKKINRGSKRFFRILLPAVWLFKLILLLAVLAAFILGVVWLAENWMDFWETVGDGLADLGIPVLVSIAGVVAVWTLGVTAMLFIFRRVRDAIRCLR